MNKTRLEAFSDGVIAIIITIMVLEMKSPEGGSLAALMPLIPVFFSYVISFVFVGIYWNNHHHLMQTVKQVNGKILWANLHLLFWLSIIPFCTSWVEENFFDPWPFVLYGINMQMAGLAYYILIQAIISHHGDESDLKKVIGGDLKGKISHICYWIAIPLAFFNTILCFILYAIVAAMWFIPDKRIERLFGKDHNIKGGIANQ